MLQIQHCSGFQHCSHYQRLSRALAVSLTLLALLLTGCGGGSKSTSSATGGTSLTRTEFAYIVNRDDNTVAQFRIGADGGLAPLQPATVPVTANAFQVLVTPNARFVYVIAQTDSGDAAASQFQINANGTLTPLVPPAVPLGLLLPPTITIAPPVLPSNFLHAPDTTLPSTTYPRPVQIAMDPQGRFLYAPAASQILAIPIAASGTLGAPAAVGTLTTPLQTFAYDPPGRFAFAGSRTDAGGASLAVFQIAADGSFTRRVGADTPIAGADTITALAEDSKGRFLYATVFTLPDSNGNSETVLAQFQIGSGGTLTLLKTTSIDLGTALPSGNEANTIFLSKAINYFQPTFDATGQFAYLPTHTPRLLEESVGADGTLTPLSSGSVLAGSVTTSISIDPSGLFLYVANRDTSISQFRRNTDGSLTPLTVPTVQTGHRSISIVTTGAAARSVTAARKEK